AADLLDRLSGCELGSPQVSRDEMIDQGVRVPLLAGRGGMPAICGDAADDVAGGVKRLCVQLRDVGHSECAPPLKSWSRHYRNAGCYHDPFGLINRMNGGSAGAGAVPASVVSRAIC